MSDFPTDLDSFTNPDKYDNANTVGNEHWKQHQNANDSIAALQAKVGVNNSAVTSSHDYKIRQLEQGTIRLTNDLGGTFLAPTVVGWQGRVLPSTSPHVFIKSNSTNTAWESVSYGTGTNTVAEGNDFRFLSNAESDQRVFISRLPNPAVAFLLVSDTAYFIYLCRTAIVLTPKHVEFWVSSIGSGAQTAEVGLFSSPNAPNKSGQTLTKLVSTATVDSLTTTGLKRNTSAFNTPIAAGTHLWAAIRTQMATSQPALGGLSQSHSQGLALSTMTAGALTGAGPWTGAIVVSGSYLNSTVAPELRVTLD